MAIKQRNSSIGENGVSAALSAPLAIKINNGIVAWRGKQRRRRRQRAASTADISGVAGGIGISGG